MGLRESQVALSLALQLNVPPPILLMLRVWGVGFPPPCWAVNDRVDGLDPIAGLIESAGATDGATNWVNPGISAANRLNDRPPPPVLPELEDLPPAAAIGTVPIDAAPAIADTVAVGCVATLMVARGTIVPAFLVIDVGSFD